MERPEKFAVLLTLRELTTCEEHVLFQFGGSSRSTSKGFRGLQLKRRAADKLKSLRAGQWFAGVGIWTAPLAGQHPLRSQLLDSCPCATPFESAPIE